MQRQIPWRGWNRADLPSPDDDVTQDAQEDAVATPTVEEVAQLLASARNPRDTCLLRLYYATGMRRNELLNACFSDIVSEELRIFVRSGKSDKDRYVLVDPGTLQLLRRWRPDWPPHSPLFDLKESRVNEIFRECADRCGLRSLYAQRGQKLTLHSLRHAFASHCYANGMDLLVFKRLLGHSQLSTTVIYVDCSWDQCQTSYASCHP